MKQPFHYMPVFDLVDFHQDLLPYIKMYMNIWCKTSILIQHRKSFI
jgi:hypothetical protein